MDEEQADEIQEHLLDAAFALDEARAAIAALGNDDQKELAASLDRVETALRSELLQPIYMQFPDLRPFNEFPQISSALPWNRVRLPPSISEADIDAILPSVMTRRSQKVAVVVGRAIGRCQELGLPISPEVLGVRIHALVEADRVEGEGDTRRWRHSEVRLKS
jgi:hypothetical protein